LYYRGNMHASCHCDQSIWEIRDSISHGADYHRIVEKATGRVVCQIDKRPKDPRIELDVCVRLYTPDGFLLEAHPDGINVGASLMIGNLMQGCGTGIAIGDCSGGAGIALHKPPNAS